MSQPPAYTPVHSFVADSATLADFPGQALDVEFQDIKTTTDAIRTNLALIQRDDGALANGVVTYESLSTSLQAAGLAPAVAWVTGTAYQVGSAVVINSALYRCLVAHTSGTFATDLAAGKWVLVSSLIYSAGTNISLAGSTFSVIPNPVFTTVNGNTFTSGTYTLTGAAGKTFTFSNTLTLAGTDGTTLTFPTTSATIARTDTGQTFTGTNAFGVLTATTVNGNTFTTGTYTLTGTAAKTLTFTNSLTLSGTDGTTLTFPSTSATLARTDAGQTFTGTNAFGVLTATTVNGNTFTAGTYTLTGTAAKTLSFTNTLTLSGTDSTVMTFPSTSATLARTDAGNAFTGNQSATGSILSSSASGGVGYTTGAGAAVTQITSRSTAVTINTPTGAITLFTAAGSATPTFFNVNNSSVAATDVVHLSVKSGASNNYLIFVTATSAGSFQVGFQTTGGVASDTPIFNYVVIKGSAS